MTFDLLTLTQLACICGLGCPVCGLRGLAPTVTGLPLLVLLIPLRMAVPLILVFDLVSGSPQDEGSPLVSCVQLVPPSTDLKIPPPGPFVGW